MDRETKREGDRERDIQIAHCNVQINHSCQSQLLHLSDEKLDHVFHTMTSHHPQSNFTT